MNDVATRSDISALQNEIRDSFNDVTSLLQTFMQQVDDRFNKVEQEIVDLRQSHNRLVNTIDGFVARIDKYETELTARDSQFEKLLAWARKVSDKTGIPLEDI